MSCLASVLQAEHFSQVDAESALEPLEVLGRLRESSLCQSTAVLKHNFNSLFSAVVPGTNLATLNSLLRTPKPPTSVLHVLQRTVHRSTVETRICL